MISYGEGVGLNVKPCKESETNLIPATVRAFPSSVAMDWAIFMVFLICSLSHYVNIYSRNPFLKNHSGRGKESYLAPIHRQFRKLVFAPFADCDFESRGLGCALGEFSPDGAAGGVVELGVGVAEVDAACGVISYLET